MPISERLARYAEDARDRQKCPQCKGPIDDCQDSHKAWFPQRHVCYKTLELISANRKYAALHKDLPYHDGSFESWSKEQTATHPYRFDDGVHLWVADTDFDPDGTWLG